MTTAGLRVLLVEDNPGDARLIAETLADVPGRPFVLESVATLATALAARDRFDVVLLDLSLPDAFGIDTVSRMLSGDTKVPVVVLTGTADNELARRAVQAGAQDYLVKGEVSPELLARTLRYAIERRRAEEDALLARETRRARFVVDVGTELFASLDIAEMGRRLTRALVPALAECCAVDVAGADGVLERAGCSFGDPSRVGELEAMLASARAAIEDAEPARRSVTVAQRGGAVLAVPLRGRGVMVGLLTLVRGAPYGEEDRLLIEEVASRAALAIENARLYRDAQHALHARDEMMAIVSHDLRNPLSVIGLALRAVAPGVAGDPSRSAMVKRAQNAFDRMARLIEDLLDVARIDQGTLSVDRSPHDLAALLREYADSQRPLADERGIQLEVDAASPVVAELDRERIAQVLANLVGNALKFTPRGGTVRLAARRDGEGARVSVSDTGPGIAEENLPRVFDRFWQSNRAAAKQGVGLGLAIAKGVVEAHGGTISVTSAAGQGTTFCFTLPAIDPDVVSAA